MVDTKRLKVEMVLAGVTQTSLSEMIGMDSSVLSLKISGKRGFTVEEASKIVNALGISGELGGSIFFAQVVA